MIQTCLQSSLIALDIIQVAADNRIALLASQAGSGPREVCHGDTEAPHNGRALLNRELRALLQPVGGQLHAVLVSRLCSGPDDHAWPLKLTAQFSQRHKSSRLLLYKSSFQGHNGSNKLRREVA